MDMACSNLYIDTISTVSHVSFSLPSLSHTSSRFFLLKLLSPMYDDTNIALRMHNTHTHPLFQENRAFGRLGIHFDCILHQKEGK